VQKARQKQLHKATINHYNTSGDKLGRKQGTMADESTPVASELQPGTAVTGTVKNLVLCGAFVDVGQPREALLHISQFGRTDFRNIEDVVKPGDTIEGFILRADGDQIALTMVKPPALPWSSIDVGSTYRGTVIRIEKFGAFVDIGAERPGMVHVSEMADGYVGSPDDVVRVGDVIDVRVIKVNRKRRQIDLSMKDDSPIEVDLNEDVEAVPTAMELALRRAQMGSRKDAGQGRGSSRRSRSSYDTDEIFKRTINSQPKR
jgi:transcriptional accessory protein Tex/SPT6